MLQGDASAVLPVHAGVGHLLPLDPGQLANRVVTCGSHRRAEVIAAANFGNYAPSAERGEAGEKVEEGESLTEEHANGFVRRVFPVGGAGGFRVLTGTTLSGVRLSVVAIGMGRPMMDILVREARRVVPAEETLCIVRLGTCGGLREEAVPGTVVVAADGCSLVLRNPDAFSGKTEEAEDDKAYWLSEVVPADGPLSAALSAAFTAAEIPTLSGGGVTADSFYSSQGREDPLFLDLNEGLLDRMRAKYPKVLTVEMESFQLLHTAACVKQDVAGRIRASAAAIVLDNVYGGVLELDRLRGMERAASQAVVAALLATELD